MIVPRRRKAKADQGAGGATGDASGHPALPVELSIPGVVVAAVGAHGDGATCFPRSLPPLVPARPGYQVQAELESGAVIRHDSVVPGAGVQLAEIDADDLAVAANSPTRSQAIGMPHRSTRRRGAWRGAGVDAGGRPCFRLGACRKPRFWPRSRRCCLRPARAVQPNPASQLPRPQGPPLVRPRLPRPPPRASPPWLRNRRRLSRPALLSQPRFRQSRLHRRRRRQPLAAAAVA